MNKILLLVPLLVIMSCNQGEKNQPATATDSISAPITAKAPNMATVLEPIRAKPSSTIEAIRQKVEHINTAALQKKHFEFMCDETMMADYFYENGEIVKIAVDFGTVGDVYAKEGYYYNAGKLIFLYEFTEGGPACEGCIKTNEYRSYIANDKTVKYLKDKSEKPCKKCEFKPSARQYKLLQAITQQEVKDILCQ